MVTLSILHHRRIFLLLLLSMNLVAACRSNQPAETLSRWEVLPQMAAEMLAREPLDSGNFDRYIVHARREAFKSTGTSIGPDTLVSAWYSGGGSLLPVTWETLQSDSLTDFNDTKRPYKHSYVNFVIRSYSTVDQTARLFVTEEYGGPLGDFVELTLRWDGSRWQKESLARLPGPPPDQD
jgi:hypothetical protein